DTQNLNTARAFETLNIGEANGIRGAWTFYTVNQMYDIATILMNEVRSTISTVWDANNNITSYTYYAYYDWNSEQGTCGPGWNLISTNNLIQAGGVGYNYTKSKQSGKFGYQGFFDCPGGYYQNNLK